MNGLAKYTECQVCGWSYGSETNPVALTQPFCGKHQHLGEQYARTNSKVDAAIAAKKERLIEKADRYFSDGSHILYEKTADNMTNVDIRKAIESAQSVIETLSVWLAINNGEVD